MIESTLMNAAENYIEAILDGEVLVPLGALPGIHVGQIKTVEQSCQDVLLDVCSSRIGSGRTLAGRLREG